MEIESNSTQSKHIHINHNPSVYEPKPSTLELKKVLNGEVEVSHQLEKTILSQYAKTFALAGLFLPKKILNDAATIYTFCRLVDDIADEELLEQQSAQNAQNELNKLSMELLNYTPRPICKNFLQLLERLKIPVEVPQELIKGCREDLDQKIMPNTRSLIRYCYRVAGTVGIMMAKALGVKKKCAFAHAIDLGIAMQLTNICRDIAEDATNRRVYLPVDQLQMQNILPQEILNYTLHETQLVPVVKWALALADQFYQSGWDGLRYIPIRSRFAILTASLMYRRIGVKLLHRECTPFQGRVCLTPREKLLEILKSVYLFFTPNILGISKPKRHKQTLHSLLENLPLTNSN